jgi:hypothetical protein
MPFVVEPIATSADEPGLLQEARSRLLTPENLPTTDTWVVDRERGCVLLCQRVLRRDPGEPHLTTWLALDPQGIYRLVTERLAERKDGRRSRIRRKVSVGRFGGERPGYSDPSPLTQRWVAEALRVFEQWLMGEYYAHIDLEVVDACNGAAL